MEYFMDMHRNRPEGAHAAPYIWLRYSTQFTTGGRAHTIEMDIPVPVGASAEQREQLIREAEAGIEQLYRQIEKRGTQRNQQRTPETSRPQETARHSGGGYSQPAQSSPPQQAAAQTPAHEAPEAISLQEKHEAADTTARTTIGSEMPVTHNLSSSAPGNIRLAQFIQIIKNNWGLTPKEAMDLLQVKTLNNMNYRDLLRQLESLVQQRAEGAPKNTANQPRPIPTPAPVPHAPRISPSASSTTMRDTGPRPASSSPPQPKPAPPVATTNRAPAPPSPTASPKPPAPAASPTLAGPTNIPVFPIRESALREVPRSYKFEEVDEELEEAQEDSTKRKRAVCRTRWRVSRSTN
ncbi:MAG: hypothetical protein NVS3B14_12850 [Ktedonobacteraceae bacterium]